MAGWGDHIWDADPWGGEVVVSSSLAGGFIVAWDDPDDVDPLGTPGCRAHKRLDLCDLLPKMYCDDDNDPEVGGTGAHHQVLEVIRDWLFGSANQTGIADDIVSLVCIFDHKEAPNRFLDARLRHLGFTLDLPLTVAQKRKIIPLLVRNIYKQKGSKPSLEEAFRLFLGIPVEFIAARGTAGGKIGLECGTAFDLSLTDLVPGGTSIRVPNPAHFTVGQPIVITDTTAPYVVFEDTPITSIVSDRVFFDAPVPAITGTIEAGAQVFCDQYCDNLQNDDPTIEGGCSFLGASQFDPTDRALYTFYVDIQRTVNTTTLLSDGDSQVDVDDADFIIPGTRIRVTDLVAPINPVTEIKILDVVGDTLFFDPVSLDEPVEIGAEIINLFNQEEVDLIADIVEFAKWNSTFHVITRDRGDAAVVIG